MRCKLRFICPILALLLALLLASLFALFINFIISLIISLTISLIEDPNKKHNKTSELSFMMQMHFLILCQQCKFFWNSFLHHIYICFTHKRVCIDIRTLWTSIKIYMNISPHAYAQAALIKKVNTLYCHTLTPLWTIYLLPLIK